MDKQNQAVIPFSFGDHLVRVIKDEDNTPWWVARDVCKILDLANPSKAVQNLDDDEKLVSPLVIAGQNRQVITISESGLYTLIFRSNKPEAKTFRRWVVCHARDGPGWVHGRDWGQKIRAPVFSHGQAGGKRGQISGGPGRVESPELFHRDACG
jgi:hypothetical protein